MIDTQLNVVTQVIWIFHYRISCAWNYETKANKESKAIYFSVCVKPELQTRPNASTAVMEDEMENTQGPVYNEFGYNVQPNTASRFIDNNVERFS